MIFFGERSPRLAPSEFTEHYPRERNHQELGNRFILPEASVTANKSVVQRRSRLGDMLQLLLQRGGMTLVIVFVDITPAAALLKIIAHEPQLAVRAIHRA